MTLIDIYAIETAIQAEQPILITYTAADGERTTRTIEPYELATTHDGHAIVRAMDRRTGQPRTFRLERIECVSVRPGPFILDRPTEHRPVQLPQTLVRYHGSKIDQHGVMRLLGICGCHRCAYLGERYRLAEPGSHECVMRCVRPASLSAMSDEETAAYHARAEADAAEQAALERIRADIAAIDPAGYFGDAAHWTPGDEDNPYAR